MKARFHEREKENSSRRWLLSLEATRLGSDRTLVKWRISVLQEKQTLLEVGLSRRPLQIRERLRLISSTPVLSQSFAWVFLLTINVLSLGRRTGMALLCLTVPQLPSSPGFISSSLPALQV